MGAYFCQPLLLGPGTFLAGAFYVTKKNDFLIFGSKNNVSWAILERYRAQGPGPRDRVQGPGPVDRAQGPGPVDRAQGPGPVDRALGTGPKGGPVDRAQGPGPRARDQWTGPKGPTFFLPRWPL